MLRVFYITFSATHVLARNAVDAPESVQWLGTSRAAGLWAFHLCHEVDNSVRKPGPARCLHGKARFCIPHEGFCALRRLCALSPMLATRLSPDTDGPVLVETTSDAQVHVHHLHSVASCPLPVCSCAGAQHQRHSPHHPAGLGVAGDFYFLCQLCRPAGYVVHRCCAWLDACSNGLGRQNLVLSAVLTLVVAPVCAGLSVQLLIFPDSLKKEEERARVATGEPQLPKVSLTSNPEEVRRAFDAAERIGKAKAKSEASVGSSDRSP